MAETDLQSAQVFGEQGEPCQECGAPLAADQRYCVNCGERRAGPRVDYRELIGSREVQPAAEEPAAMASPPSPDSTKAERDYAPLAAVGGIAVLGLMLLVGVLIGKGNSTTPASAPAPIVRVGEPATDSTASAEASESGSAAKESKGSKKPKGGGTGAKAVSGGLTGSAARSSEGTVQASADDLEALQNQTGDSYQETIKKLPNKIATPGKPPPIDTSTEPGGGGAAETIK